jgi:hypothetical protein
MEEIVKILPLNPNTFEFQEYSPEDISLISSNLSSITFNPNTNHIEYFIYDLNNTILYSNEIGYPNYSILDNQLSLEPLDNLKSQGYDEGQYNVLYNFLSNKLGSSALNRYYIDEISSDRTEIRLNTTSIPPSEVISSTNDFINQIQSNTGNYLDFYLNFGSNRLIIANNILLDDSNSNNPTVLIKLYEPLPTEFKSKTECWVVEQIAESLAYNIDILISLGSIDDNIYIKGPNFNIGLKDQINNSTPYNSYTSLSTSTSQQGTGSFLYQLNSLLGEKGIEINVDYTDYSNFVYMSSAQTRLENFYYKLSLIETYQNSASLSSGTTTNYYVSSSNIIWQNKIDEIITNFDGYEYYLYYDSGSKAWPKLNTAPPYINVTTTSPTGISFLNTQSTSASLYDDNNDNALINAIPSYIIEDSNNSQYELFVEMLAQMFDNIYLYIENITQKYNADNRLNYGVSKDLIADVLRDLGVKIYQNNFSSNDLYSSLLGFTPSGSLFNIPDASTVLPTPNGYEYINTFITASSTSSLSPVDDINKEIYKRIYHNLPYLLKKKGTVEGLKTLINIYGIPDTILTVNEFGGKDKNQTTYDYWKDEFNYSYKSTGSYYISSSFNLNPTWGSPNNVPGAIEFRFKAESIPPTNKSQSLWFTDKGLGIFLEYTGSGLTTGSYLGSPINPEYQYGNLKFISETNSASIYLPFFDGGWWSVLLNSGSSGYNLYVKNSIYNGNDGSVLGYQASSSLNVLTQWSASTKIYFASSSANYIGLSGSLQEIRYYSKQITQDNFNAYVMNPSSIEQSQYLAFRASLGSELYTGSKSIHPKVTGSWTITSSFVGTSNFYTSSNPIYVNNTETYFYNQPPLGIQNIVSNKIKNSNIILPNTSSIDSNIPNQLVLSSQTSIQQIKPISSSYTRDTDYVEIAFSPQNEINDDIMSTLGFFNVGDYIGDPRQTPSRSDSYPDLDILRDNYFQKYTHNYNIWDYIRLIKYFDNSLFKMLQDWTPVRTSLASGVVLKQHLLERNKYTPPQINQNHSEYTSSISMYTITGSNGGFIDIIPTLTQSWTGDIESPSGSIPFTQSDKSEFFNGQFSGSRITVTNGDLNTDDTYLPLDNNVYDSRLSTIYMDVDYTDNVIIPVNQQSILDNTATRFAIPDSNYTMARSINPRYNGSRTTSPGFNQPIYNNLTQLSTQSQEPNASRYSNWFVYFDYIESSYPEVPNGGNIHCVYLVNTEGQAIPLTDDNKYVSEISNIFNPKSKANIIPISSSTNNNIPKITIFDGGTKFQTICTLSGSVGGNGNAIGSLSNESFISYNTYFTTGSNTSIICDLDITGNNEYWLRYILGNSEEIEANSILYPSDDFYLYNKNSNQTLSSDTNGISYSINYYDTLLPLKPYDIIRFGDARVSSSLNSSSLDSSFTGIQNITILSSSLDYFSSSSLHCVPGISPYMTSSFIGGTNNLENQNWRIFRRVPNETNIVIQSLIPFSTPGLLIPENFNPNYNPYDLARKAGII